MSRTIEQYLLKNKANFMMKYDPVREKNRYTIMLFDTVKGERIIGGDTNSIEETEQRMRTEIDSSFDFTLINDLFYRAIKPYQEVREVFVILSINYRNGGLEYGLTVCWNKNTVRRIVRACEELAELIKTENAR